MYEMIRKQIMDSINTKELIFGSEDIISSIQLAAEMIIEAYHTGNKVLLCGNGGSASDAQHIEGELVGRFKLDRKGLPAIALTSNSSSVTSIGNDLGFDNIFVRQVEAHGKSGDILIVISTSGKSANILNAMKYAASIGIKTIALLGKGGGDCIGIADISITVPSQDTPRIQESHILIGHILCDLVEKKLFLKE